jgi:tripartite-type tricarboxylate transporter receptor subunit TctC
MSCFSFGFHSRSLFRVAAVLAGLALSQHVAAQSFPSKPIRVIVPFPPAAVLDTMGRLVAQKMSESVGQPVVVENRAGANGIIGSEFVARSAPDGYTLLVTTPSTHISSVYLMKSLPFDPRKDVTPITAAVDSVTVLAVHPSVPVTTAAELIDYLKRNPGKVAYGSAGVGNVFHLIGEMFQSHNGVSLVHVPYKGIVQAVQDTATGQVQMVFSAVNNVMPHMKAGRLKVLAVLNPKRYEGLPGVPSVTEVMPGFERPASWFGFLGPAGLPQQVLARLNGEIVKALNALDARAKLEAMGLMVIGNTPQEFAAQYHAGFDIYGRIIKAAGIQPE